MRSAASQWQVLPRRKPSSLQLNNFSVFCQRTPASARWVVPVVNKICFLCQVKPVVSKISLSTVEKKHVIMNANWTPKTMIFSVIVILYAAMCCSALPFPGSAELWLGNGTDLSVSDTSLLC